MERLHRWKDEGDEAVHADAQAWGTPGKRTLTSHYVLRKADRDDVAPGADDAIARAAGSAGTTLPEPLQDRFERTLGADLSAVRIHTGAESSAAAEAVGARAYTIGNDIHFKDGEFDPTSREGQHLIAHEVAHTVQQQGGSPERQDKLEVSNAGDAAEVEADQAADAMLDGGSFAISASPTGIARKGPTPAPKANEKPGSKEKPFPVGMDGITIGLGPNSKFKLPWTSGASIEASKEVSEEIKKEFKERKAFQAGGLPGGLSLSAEGKASLKASANASIKGALIDLPPPYVDESGAQVTISGGGDVKASVGGLVGAGVYVGIPPINVGAEGYLTLEGSMSTGASITGQGTWAPNGGWTGTATFAVPIDLTVKGTGGIRLIYSALIKSGELQKFELASKDILKANITCKVVCDLGTGTVTDSTESKFEWLALDFPKAPMTPQEKAMYRKRAKEEERQRDGASGAGPGVPAEAFDEDEPPAEKTFDQSCAEDPNHSVMCP